MNLARIVVATLSAGLLVFAPTPAQPALDSAVAQGIATALGGKTVSDIINEVRLAGVSLIDQATTSGNALIARAGNEAGVLAGNLTIALQDSLNVSFDRLSEERKTLLVEAEAIRRSLRAVGDGAYNFKDTAVLDLNALATTLPFVKQSFFVQSVRGLSYVPQPADFRLQIAASTLGINEDVATELQVYKGHGPAKKLLPDVVVDQSKQRFTAEVAVPNKHFQSDFKDADLVVAPVTLSFLVKRKSGWWIFSSTKTQTFDVPLYLNLFPRTAATLASVTRQPGAEWVKTGSKSDRYQTPNRHCSKNCGGEPTRGGNKIEFAVAGGAAPYKIGYKRLANPTQRCIGGNCAFSDSFNLRLTENDTRLIFTWDTWSTSGTWEATADIQEYQAVREVTTTSGVVLAQFGKVVELIVPRETTYGVLKVRTFTKQQYEIKLGEPDPNGILSYQGTSPAGPAQARLSYRVNEPSTVMSSRFY